MSRTSTSTATGTVRPEAGARSRREVRVDLATELRLSVMRLRRRLIAERHPDNDLSGSATAVLWALRREGELGVGALAARERVRPPSMTRTIDALVGSGLVRRRPHPDDGRQVLVGLTPAGEAVVRADARRRDEWLSRRLAELSPAERDVLRAAAPLLQRLADSD